MHIIIENIYYFYESNIVMYLMYDLKQIVTIKLMDFNKNFVYLEKIFLASCGFLIAGSLATIFTSF